MMLKSVLRYNAIRSVANRRQFSSLPVTLYNNVWRKSNALYITYILTGCLIFEVVYGKATDFVWEISNKGKLYHHIDWSKFKSEDE